MDLASIYSLIEEDLNRVRQKIHEEGGSAGSFISELLNHSLLNGGKLIRPAVAILSCRLFRPTTEELVELATGIELLHAATLVHDDAIDDASVRRGKTTIHIKWGKSRAILFGDYLFALAASHVSRSDNFKVIRLFGQTAAMASSGELEHTVEKLSLGTLRQSYYCWVEAKTASLFMAAAQSGGLLAGAPEKEVNRLREFGLNLGMLFQMADDILDFTGTVNETGKSVGMDLSHGNLTLPAIVFLEKNVSVKKANDFLSGRKKLNYQKIMERIREPEIIQASRDIAFEFRQKALAAIVDFPSCPSRTSLESLLDYALERKR